MLLSAVGENLRVETRPSVEEGKGEVEEGAAEVLVELNVAHEPECGEMKIHHKYPMLLSAPSKKEMPRFKYRDTRVLNTAFLPSSLSVSSAITLWTLRTALR